MRLRGVRHFGNRLLSRTPYGCHPYGVDTFPPDPSPEFRRRGGNGHILVYQDVRPYNGRVGIMGLSEGVFYAWMGGDDFEVNRPLLPFISHLCSGANVRPGTLALHHTAEFPHGHWDISA